MAKSDLPALPRHRYVPGRTERHPEAAFDAIRAAALKPTASETAAENDAWRYGLRLFDAGFWWEAHEVLEPVWMNARPNSAERAMVQAVIQLANAALKREMGKTNAVRRICDIAEGHAAETGEGAMGLSRARLTEAVVAVRTGGTQVKLSG